MKTLVWWMPCWFHTFILKVAGYRLVAFMDNFGEIEQLRWMDNGEYFFLLNKSPIYGFKEKR